MIYKRGRVYWFNFVYDGKHIQKSTRQGNAQVARDAEAAERMRLIKGEHGIERKERPVCPTLKDFKVTFTEWVRSDISDVRTQRFYETCYSRLLEFPELSRATLSEIDKALIERFKLSVKETSKTTINRYLATLRKALYYAADTLNLIDKVPVVKLYKRDKDNTVERECEYVYTTADYQAWLTAAREPLRSASVLAHDCGICRGEILALQWDCITLNSVADANGFWGTIDVKRGLKRKERRRTLSITEDMAAVLQRLKTESRCQHVFTSLRDATKPLSGNTLANQHRDMMETCSFHPDAGLHALRHTFLTEAGRYTQNVQALKKTRRPFPDSDNDAVCASGSRRHGCHCRRGAEGPQAECHYDFHYSR